MQILQFAFSKLTTIQVHTQMSFQKCVQKCVQPNCANLQCMYATKLNCNFSRIQRYSVYGIVQPNFRDKSRTELSRAIDKTVDSDPTPSQRTVQCRVASVSSGFSELCTHSQLYILFGGSPWEEGRADGGTQHLYTHTSGAHSCDALARFLSMVMSMARRCAGADVRQWGYG